MSALQEQYHESKILLNAEEKKHLTLWVKESGKLYGFNSLKKSETEFLLNGTLTICFYKSEIPYQDDTKDYIFIPIDFLYNSFKGKALASLICTKLGLNQRVFARNCVVQKLTKPEVQDFLNEHHLMGYTGVQYGYGLFYNNELLAVAAFSKGRKLNRLADGERSYELVRFASKQGFSISGGLSKCLKAFIKEYRPADIMTYIDKQFYSGRGFYTIGFELHSESKPLLFFVNNNYERRLIREHNVSGTDMGYCTKNLGNLKLVWHLRR